MNREQSLRQVAALFFIYLQVQLFPTNKGDLSHAIEGYYYPRYSLLAVYLASSHPTVAYAAHNQIL